MNTGSRYVVALFAVWLLSLSCAHAHMMVSQRGTLNMVGNGAFMVLSLPVSAFAGIDDDGDAKLSQNELRTHAQSIEAQVHRGVQLISGQGAQTLEGVLLTAEAPNHAPDTGAEQIVVMGRFRIDPEAADLKLVLKIFGKNKAEQVEQITVTRSSETQLLTLTPQQNSKSVLPAVWKIVVEQVVSGATHILAGLDHILFLLVALAAGWSFGKKVMALTCFTLGHGATLAASVFLDVTVSPTIIEPVIAATIVGMAVFDQYYLRNNLPLPTGLRLSLILGCALIHGLGLSQAYSDLGLKLSNKLISLASFNAGIEIGQLAVLVFAAGLMKVIAAYYGKNRLNLITRLASHVAVVVGTVWVLERLVFS